MNEYIERFVSHHTAKYAPQIEVQLTIQQPLVSPRRAIDTRALSKWIPIPVLPGRRFASPRFVLG